MPPCSRCERLPDVPVQSGRLFLWTPLRHSRRKLWSWGQEHGLCPEVDADKDCLVIQVADPQTQFPAIAARVTHEERHSTRALYIEGDREPDFSDFPRVCDLDQLVALAESEWLVDLLSAQRLTSYFHAIVPARDPERPFAYEALMRGVSPQGELISPFRILTAAKATGMLFQVDRAARLSAIRQATEHQLGLPIFINFSPAAVYDPQNCLATTVAQIEKSGLPPENFVFEVVESEEVESTEHLQNILKFYRERGFLIALDDLGSGYGSLNRLSQLRPDFVKLDMQLIRGVDTDEFKAVIADRILRLARDLGIRTVVEGVETLGELRWAQEHGADLVQGFLLSRPANPPQTPRLPD